MSKKQTAAEAMTATAEAMTATAHLVRGINLNKVDEAVVTRYVKKLGLKPVDDSLREKVVVLADRFMDKKSPNEITCDKGGCGGVSDDSVEECPYCGAADSAESDDEEPTSDVAPKTDEVINRTQARPKKKKAKKLEPARTARETTALVPVPTAEVQSAKDLDKAVKAIRSYQVEGAMSLWKIGTVLNEVHTKGLFGLRLNGDGKRMHRTFGMWVQKELVGIGVRYAYDLMSVAETFSEDVARTEGVTKLRVIARIPDEAKRNNLIARSKQELLTRNQLLEAAAQETEGKEPRDTGRANNARGRGGETPAVREARVRKAKDRAEEKGVTITIRPGEVAIPMLKRVKDGDPPERAFDVGDAPYCVEDTLNGIKVRYLIELQEDGLCLVIQRTRE